METWGTGIFLGALLTLVLLAVGLSGRYRGLRDWVRNWPVHHLPGGIELPAMLPLPRVPRPRLRRRRPDLPPLIGIREVPVTVWAGAGVCVLAGFLNYQLFTIGPAVGWTMAVICLVFGPRTYRLDRITAEAFDKCEPICLFEKHAARNKTRWRSLLKSFGLAIDYTYSDLARAGTRKTKWIRLRLAPRWSLWPQVDHVTAVGVRIPTRVQVSQVVDLLRAALAEDFFNLPADELTQKVRRRLRKTWVWYAVPAGGPGETEERPTYADQAAYLNGPDPWDQAYADGDANIDPTVPELPRVEPRAS